MTWRDVLRFSLRSLARRGARSVLTGVSVAIGAALLVSLLAISATADSRVVSQLGKGGPVAAIQVVDQNPAPNALDSDTLQATGQHDLNPVDVQSIRALPHVASVQTVLNVPTLAVSCPPAERAAEADRPTAACRLTPDPYDATLVGAPLGQPRALPITIVAGRIPQPSSHTEVAVTQSYLDRLHLGQDQAAEVLGTDVEFATMWGKIASNSGDHYFARWFEARIVGVVTQSIGDGDFLVPLAQAEQVRPRLVVDDPDGRTKLATTRYSGLVVTADSLTDLHAVREEIAGLGYANAAPEHLIDSVLKYLHVVDIVLYAIGAVALSIAGLGIASSLLSAVRERWREIGVLKAIGARDGDVLRWFLVEAGVLGLVGGIAGSVVGIGMAAIVGVLVNGYLISQGLQGIDLGSLPLQLVLLAPLATTVVAIIAGTLPALRAARLPAPAGARCLTAPGTSWRRSPGWWRWPRCCSAAAARPCPPCLSGRPRCTPARRSGWLLSARARPRASAPTTRSGRPSLSACSPGFPAVPPSISLGSPARRPAPRWSTSCRLRSARRRRSPPSSSASTTSRPATHRRRMRQT